MKSADVRPNVLVRDVKNVKYIIVGLARRFRTQEIDVNFRQRGTPRFFNASMYHFLEDFDLVPKGDP